jgi:hypothetical protein
MKNRFKYNIFQLLKKIAKKSKYHKYELKLIQIDIPKKEKTRFKLPKEKCAFYTKKYKNKRSRKRAFEYYFGDAKGV